MLNQEQIPIFNRAVAAVAASLKKPILYGPNNKPLAPSSSYTYQRSAAKRAGSMKNWIPQRLISRQQEALERERIAERSIDLVNNDPHAAGVLDTFAHTVIGSGLMPQPTLDPDYFPEMDKKESRQIQAKQRNIYKTWSLFADAGERMSFGQIQFLAQCNLLRYGEYLILLPMLDDPLRPYALACQILSPLRLKTPLDKVSNSNIRDGVEMGEYGQAVAYWIKKSDPEDSMRYTADISKNFLRVPRRKGHRLNVIHGFVAKNAEQVRGVSFFAPAMKLFRDLNDYLDAELVSNIVTAAFSLFIETEQSMDPEVLAARMASRTETFLNPDSENDVTRYQEMIPGMIMYGAMGEKPHPIAANRPGQTFAPFTMVIKKAIALGLGVPYPVLFKDVEGVNFAGFRSAMLDAWRVFMAHRDWMGQDLCQPVYTMLQEEAWLRGELPIKDFYSNMWAWTAAKWWGSPKGDIEPIKAIKADVEANKHRLKTKAKIIREREGEDYLAVFDQLAEEEQAMKDRNLSQSQPVGSNEKAIMDEITEAVEDGKEDR